MKQFLIALLIIAVILIAAFSISYYIEVNFEKLHDIAAETLDLAQRDQMDEALAKSQEFEAEYNRVCGVLDYTANTLDQEKLEVAYRKMVTYLKAGQIGDCAAAFEELHRALEAMRESEKFSPVTIF